MDEKSNDVRLYRHNDVNRKLFSNNIMKRRNAIRSRYIIRSYYGIFYDIVLLTAVVHRV